ncbi:MAG: FAD-binding oxidoreductase [Acidimicrobiales bacterium]
MTVVDRSPCDDHRWLVANRADLWEPARVVAVDREASGTTLRLRLAQPPDVLAGQYYLVRLVIDRPPGEVQQAYSLSSSPSPLTTDVEITVREVLGGRASPILARRVQVRDLLQVRGPFGFLTWNEADGGPLGLIGAGSGVAPLVSIVRYATARHLDTPMTMLCSSRDRRSVLLRAPLDELHHRQRWFKLVHTFTRSQRDPIARYHRRIDADMLAEVMESGDLAAWTFYVAGPADMVLAVRTMLGALGADDDRIYSEDHA